MTSGQDFDQRFEALAAVAYRVAYRLLGNRSDAQEVAQEALARAFASWPAVSQHAEPWVARVSTNLAIARWRRRRPSDVLQSEGTTIGDVEDKTLQRLGLAEALRRLPRRQREAIALRYLADLSERDVAAAMSTSVGSVKQHTHRALDRLRHELAVVHAPEDP